MTVALHSPLPVHVNGAPAPREIAGRFTGNRTNSRARPRTFSPGCIPHVPTTTTGTSLRLPAFINRTNHGSWSQSSLDVYFPLPTIALGNKSTPFWTVLESRGQLLFPDHLSCSFQITWECFDTTLQHSRDVWRTTVFVAIEYETIDHNVEKAAYQLD